MPDSRQLLYLPAAKEADSTDLRSGIKQLRCVPAAEQSLKYRPMLWTRQLVPPLQ